MNIIELVNSGNSTSITTFINSIFIIGESAHKRNADGSLSPKGIAAQAFYINESRLPSHTL